MKSVILCLSTLPNKTHPGFGTPRKTGGLVTGTDELLKFVNLLAELKFPSKLRGQIIEIYPAYLLYIGFLGRLSRISVLLFNFFDIRGV